MVNETIQDQFRVSAFGLDLSVISVVPGPVHEGLSSCPLPALEIFFRFVRYGTLEDLSCAVSFHQEIHVRPRVLLHQCVWLSQCVPSHDLLLLGQDVPMDPCVDEAITKSVISYNLVDTQSCEAQVWKTSRDILPHDIVDI